MGDNKYRYIVERPAGFKDDKTPLFYIEVSGDSLWTKPTTSSTGGAIVDGSIALETDTGKFFFWNEAAVDWIEQGSFQG